MYVWRLQFCARSLHVGILLRYGVCYVDVGCGDEFICPSFAS